MIAGELGHQLSTVLGPCFDQSWFHLPTNLARFVLGTVDIHIQIAGLETGVLVIRELGACGDGPNAIGASVERNNGRPALARRTYVMCATIPSMPTVLMVPLTDLSAAIADRACPGR